MQIKSTVCAMPCITIDTPFPKRIVEKQFLVNGNTISEPLTALACQPTTRFMCWSKDTKAANAGGNGITGTTARMFPLTSKLVVGWFAFAARAGNGRTVGKELVYWGQ